MIAIPMRLRLFALLLLSLTLTAVEEPTDPRGDALRASAVWTSEPVPAQGAVHGAFRTNITLTQVPATAPLHIFAATRYELWVNGTPLLRGPARFELQVAEYDTLDVAPHLRAGANVIAVLVHRDRPTGRIRQVVPGLTVDLDLGDRRVTTGSAWKAAPERSFGDTGGVWSSLRDRRDATAMAAWTAPDFDDAAWAAAVPVERASSWPRLVARRSALQRETAIAPATITIGGQPATLPLDLAPGTTATLTYPRIIQAYPVLTFTAKVGTTLAATYVLPTPTPGKTRANGTDTWRCRDGRQTWRTTDTNALKSVDLKAEGGPVRLEAFQAVEVLYSFDVAGSFTCPDDRLTRLWTMMARSAQLLSEDAYVDCAERERVEWMECSPPMAQTTRVAMTVGGQPRSDEALLKAVLWRTAQTQRDDGMVKAHTCSERWDKHAIMVDRSCDWVQLSREYHEQTGDTALVRAIWPAVARQLDAFLAKRTSRGLIQLEEWADWGNHYKYRVFEGTALNSFMYAALVDGAYLGQVAGDASASRFAQAAAALRKTMLAELWDPQAKTFGAGLYTVDPAKPEPRQGTYAGPSSGVGLCAATRHAAIYALRWGVVDDARREDLYQWIWNDRDQVMKGENAAMVVYHLIHLLYERDDPAADAWVLDCIRTKWAAQLTSPLQTSGESLGTNGTIHCYSMYPTYLLSQFVLGVRLDGPVERKALTIDPRLGGLPNASGTVVTALGLVPVTWTTTADGGLDFAVTVPAGATATVRLPTTRTAITLDGASVTASRLTKGRPVLTLGPGEHRGTVR